MKPSRWMDVNTHKHTREYQKLRWLNNNSPYIRVNDVVLIHDDSALTHLWRISRIIELIKHKSDNEVRGASVKVPRTGRTVQQPNIKSKPIECIKSHLQNNDPHRLRTVPALSHRSRRNAALVGKLRRWFEGKYSNRALTRECFVRKNS